MNNKLITLQNVSKLCLFSHQKFYSQHSSENTTGMDADILGGGDVSQWKMRHKEKVQTASACLELECNQVIDI